MAIRPSRFDQAEDPATGLGAGHRRAHRRAGHGPTVGRPAGTGGPRPDRPFEVLLGVPAGRYHVYFVAGDRFQPNPKRAVHAFCHCVPDTWHQMSVILSAAACLSWVVELTGASDEEALLREVEAADRLPGSLLFLPYLSGERTPHNDPHAKGVFFGMTHDTARADLGRAVLERFAERQVLRPLDEVEGDVPVWVAGLERTARERIAAERAGGER